MHGLPILDDPKAVAASWAAASVIIAKQAFMSKSADFISTASSRWSVAAQ
jgi:hypothetical protein